jgi:FkbM family methyltransferase
MRKREFVDASANIGNHALALSGLFKEMHSFEPGPFLFSILSLNVSSRADVIAHPYVLGSSQGSAMLVSPSVCNRGSSFLQADSLSAVSGISVAGISVEV